MADQMAWKKIRQLSKWTCLIFTALLTLSILSPFVIDIDISERRTIMFEYGKLNMYLWAGPRATTDHDSYGPDVYSCPIWLLSLGFLVLTAFLWQLDRPNFLSKQAGKKGIPANAHCLIWGFITLIAGATSLLLWLIDMTRTPNLVMFPFPLLWFGLVALSFGLILMLYSIISFKPPMKRECYS